jgi:hypothetical protein
MFCLPVVSGFLAAGLGSQLKRPEMNIFDAPPAIQESATHPFLKSRLFFKKNREILLKH